VASIRKQSGSVIHFEVGDEVYARYFGSEILTIKALADQSKYRESRSCTVKGKTYGIPNFPHYVCSLHGKRYLIPKLHLSTKSLVAETEGNRRQLGLPA